VDKSQNKAKKEEFLGVRRKEAHGGRKTINEKESRTAIYRTTRKEKGGDTSQWGGVSWVWH